MTDWQRLEQLIKWTGLSTNAFAVGIGLKRSENLYQIKRGNNGISKDLTELISKKYSTVNRAWLLTGDGEMFSNTSTDTDRYHNGALHQNVANPNPGIPYYNTDAARLVCETQRPTPTYYISVPAFGDCDFAAACTGNVMAPEIPSGAIVVFKRVDVNVPILPNEIYLVVTSDFAVLRYVRPNMEISGEILLINSISSNSTEIKVTRERIEQLYLVKGIIIHKVL